MPIDLRSDTLTQPTPAMRTAMMAAPLGDDVYAEDPSVNRLEWRTAQLLGHEAGLFCSTGSLANLLGVMLLGSPGEEVLCDVQAHIARAEMGSHAAVGGVTMRTWPSVAGVTTTAEVSAMLSPNAGPHLVSTAAIAIENTHNFGGGTIQPMELLLELRRLCTDAGVAMHLDGARLWNAHVATGVPMDEYGRLFETVSVCYSKGMGAPVGSVLVSTAERIARARVLRKRFGGGWRQAGLLAAAAEYALDHHIERLAEDHAAARLFAEQVSERAPASLAATPQTNIVVLDTGVRTGAEVAAAAAERGVLISGLGPHMVRAVTHLGVDLEQCRQAGRIVGELLSAGD